MEDAWSKVYGPGDDCLSTAVRLPLVKALNERFRALGMVGLSTDFVGQYALNTFGSLATAPWLSGLMLPGYDPTGVFYTDARHAPRQLRFVVQADSGANVIGKVNAPGYVTGTVSKGAAAQDWIAQPGEIAYLAYDEDADPQFPGGNILKVFPQSYGRPWNSYREMQIACFHLASYFADPRDRTGETIPITPLGALGQFGSWFAGIAQSENDTYSRNLLFYKSFPSPNGFTRVREREITTLNAPGSDGQRARFIYASAGRNISVDADPAYYLPESLRIESIYSRKVMLRQEGRWIIDPDPAAQPDQITLYGPAMGGDIWGPWIINDLKRAINLLVCRPLVWHYNGTYKQIFGSNSDTPEGAIGFAVDRYNVSDLHDINTLTFAFAGKYARLMRITQPFGAINYYAEMLNIQFRIAISNDPNAHYSLSLDDPFAKRIDAYTYPVEYFANTFPAPGFSTNFDPQDFILIPRQWNKLLSFPVSADNARLSAQQFGNLGQLPAFPIGPYPENDFDWVRGFQLNSSVNRALVYYDFQYAE
jgi:hypothetical protein